MKATGRFGPEMFDILIKWILPENRCCSKVDLVFRLPSSSPSPSITPHHSFKLHSIQRQNSTFRQHHEHQKSRPPSRLRTTPQNHSHQQRSPTPPERSPPTSAPASSSQKRTLQRASLLNADQCPLPPLLRRAIHLQLALKLDSHRNPSSNPPNKALFRAVSSLHFGGFVVFIVWFGRRTAHIRRQEPRTIIRPVHTTPCVRSFLMHSTGPLQRSRPVRNRIRTCSMGNHWKATTTSVLYRCARRPVSKQSGFRIDILFAIPTTTEAAKDHPSRMMLPRPLILDGNWTDTQSPIPSGLNNVPSDKKRKVSELVLVSSSRVSKAQQPYRAGHMGRTTYLVEC